MRESFDHLAARLPDSLREGEELLLNLAGETSDFVRFNHARVRQAGHVRRAVLQLELVDGNRHAQAAFDLGGDGADDLALAQGVLEELRHEITHLPEDPFLHIARGGPDVAAPVPAAGAIDSTAAVADILAAAEGLDLVGVWAAGEIVRGFAHSRGEPAWHSADSFHFDWSLYGDGDKAVKAQLGGRDWDGEALAAAMARSRAELRIMRRPPRTIAPGRYRVYLAPRALRELLDMMSWDGFGLRAHRTRRTPLLRMVTGEKRLHPGFTLLEHHAGGLAPPFTPEGFVKPPAVTLIEAGRYRDCLVEARSAREYDAAVNAASEAPEALELAAGDLPDDEVLARLDTGLYLNNLWYLNFSDRNDCRVTGMTRFAAFWVEGGEIREPVNVMRFDDTVYHLFGDGLLGLTERRERLFDEGTYGGRSLRSYLLPGALIEGMQFTL